MHRAAENGPVTPVVRSAPLVLATIVAMNDPSSDRRGKNRRNRSAPTRSAYQEATYICDSCGEEIVVPIDISAGTHQDYVEDCPVCCHPMTLHVDIDPDGEAHVEGEHE